MEKQTETKPLVRVSCFRGPERTYATTNYTWDRESLPPNKFPLVSQFRQQEIDSAFDATFLEINFYPLVLLHQKIADIAFLHKDA